MADVILSTIPAANERERLCVLLRQTADEPSRIILAQQSFSPRVGWYNQQCVEVEPSQLAMLRASLGGSAVSLPTVPAAVDESADEPITIRFPGLKSA